MRLGKNIFWLILAFAACSAGSIEVIEVYFGAAEPRGEVENPQINEASGLAAGLTNPGMLWTHNDSGNDPLIFLIDEFGKGKGSFRLVGIGNRDWEDISSGPGPENGKNYLYIAEMGDNNAIYDDHFIYRLQEPTADDPVYIDVFDTIAFRYPDGKRDAECLMIDPQTKDLYIVSKREENVGVYRAAYPQSTKEEITLEKLGTIPYHNIVAGDISADGHEVLLKTYNKILYWKRSDSGNLFNTLAKSPTEISYLPEPQGEAIAWKKDGSGFFTLSEERDGIEAVLYFYQKE